MDTPSSSDPPQVWSASERKRVEQITWRIEKSTTLCAFDEYMATLHDDDIWLTMRDCYKAGPFAQWN